MNDNDSCEGITLLPCPFCGGSKIRLIEKANNNKGTDFSARAGDFDSMVYIKCKRCGNRTPRVQNDSPEIAKRKVLELWNRRQPFGERLITDEMLISDQEEG